MAKAVFGSAVNRDQADAIVDTLKKAGFGGQDISVLMSDKNEAQTLALEKQTKVPEGAAAGVSTGFVLGAGLGWLVGIGSLAIPGLGPFLAAGPLLGALSGAGLGAAVGGLTGVLIGLSIPEYEAKRYEGHLQEGSILISAHAEDAERLRRTRSICEVAGAKDIAVTQEAA